MNYMIESELLYHPRFVSESLQGVLTYVLGELNYVVKVYSKTYKKPIYQTYNLVGFFLFSFVIFMPQVYSC